MSTNSRHRAQPSTAPSRVVLLLLVAFVATIAAARFAFDVTTAARAGAGDAPWAQDQMKFVAWNDSRWVAWIRDGSFELVPQQEGKWRRHTNASIAFVDWNGEPWQAKVEDDEFLLAHRGEWNAATKRANAIAYRDWEGKNRLRTVAQLTR